ncbi:MAG: prepilin-type N-terminal cleavage/methylation domain-containing protein [Gemmatimonadetes bacterium]|uniref:Prepilin-type N-terminal cleavage/methylation domain-containing protein n=1 Tax=Candidatus Kutchimonas denitrificans TaxID=3056748 RepID=A0AAE4Z6H2_9BACT|nr:prepilin-type N-terminal cleavage/methylation domain-containing protein [Gemmatimonadota bacterium]NIR74483.1 prepilin-type N-terminal cleavage/methylation domain-containing protein [Candidatus Kutchimonas denitrificans]NIR99895.1 prepilin-type N-terminal cleavage/methylation domain-containing protein [Gemmatimonadota bacterium]NIT66721.1 prepilin-type N-terminal cleavage/methylation domain-containing protein [Gemmatimonadota bacterium]NIU52133.1 prepilin-type N-terminal cleavage/methylation
MTRRAGFTLIELLVAIVLTGVVAVLVYGAADAGVETRRRLEERGHEMRATRAWRATLEDALRNVRPAPNYNDSAFVLMPATDGGGRPRDRLWFVTAGGLPPLTDDSDWEVIVEPTPRGLSLLAHPAGVRAPPRRLIGPPQVTGLDVRVLSGVAGARVWLETWDSPRRVPSAIELTYWTDDGPAGPPLLLQLPLGGTR